MRGSSLKESMSPGQSKARALPDVAAGPGASSSVGRCRAAISARPADCGMQSRPELLSSPSHASPAVPAHRLSSLSKPCHSKIVTSTGNLTSPGDPTCQGTGIQRACQEPVDSSESVTFGGTGLQHSCPSSSLHNRTSCRCQKSMLGLHLCFSEATCCIMFENDGKAGG